MCLWSLGCKAAASFRRPHPLWRVYADVWLSLPYPLWYQHYFELHVQHARPPNLGEGVITAFSASFAAAELSSSFRWRCPQMLGT